MRRLWLSGTLICIALPVVSQAFSGIESRVPPQAYETRVGAIPLLMLVVCLLLLVPVALEWYWLRLKERPRASRG
ncbi:MAG: hypothetical protein OHK0039_25060 [Bacteroidia bacterium]